MKVFWRWDWQSPRLAPRLLTGAVAAATLSGVLPVKPIVAIGGGAVSGKPQLLQTIRLLLGPFVAIAHEPDESHIAEVVGWDSVPVLIDTPPQGPKRQQRRQPRLPAWVAETAAVRIRRHDGLCFCTAEAANQMDLGDHPHYLELRLGHHPDNRLVAVGEDDCRARRPLLLRRMAEQFLRLMHIIFPAWLKLVEVRDGSANELERTLALLLASAWVLERDDEPQAGDFDVLQPEIDRLLGMEDEWRRPPWLQVLDCVRAVPVQLSSFNQTTLLEKIGIAAGVVVIGGAPMLDQGHRWTEAQAIAHARQDPEARKAQQLIGQYGIKILNDLPEALRTAADAGGYRCAAIAVNAPSRDTQLEHMSSWQNLVIQGMNMRVLLQAPKTRDMRSTVYFPGLGSRHCVVMPLDLVLGGMASEDPVGTAEAWRQAEA